VNQIPRDCSSSLWHVLGRILWRAVSWLGRELTGDLERRHQENTYLEQTRIQLQCWFRSLTIRWLGLRRKMDPWTP
jgi:hypothetical protein